VIDFERAIALISIAIGWFFTYQQAMKVREERKKTKLENKKLELETKKLERELRKHRRGG